jgi:RNA polymerase sigma factor (sigma-70 family)
MPEKPDALLLREYAEQGHDDAFREIVVRYTDLVYSAAFRQLDSREVAQDIAQSVFTDLARKAQAVADRLSADASLVGWLYRSTRFAALKHLRDDHRRATRERLAMEHLMTDSESAPEWERIRPILDEAMGALSDDERDAVLLRFFKNHDFRAVGVTLGISDDAAQKRVSRAVDHLREFFAKRGVTVGAGGLAAVLTANAVQAAPAGMAVAISTTAALAGRAITASTITTATKAIAMTTLQKTIVAAVIAAGVATPLVMQHQHQIQLRDENQSLRQQVDQLAPLQAENERLSNLIAQANAAPALSKDQLEELVRLRGEVGRLREATNAIAELTEENRQLRLRPSSTAKLPPNVPPGDIFPRESWAAAGYADPRSALETAIFSITKGDVQGYASSISPELLAAKQKELADQMQLTGKSLSDLQAETVQQYSALTGYRILDEKTVSDDQVIMSIYLDGAGVQKAVRMKKIGDEWKVDAAP